MSRRMLLPDSRARLSWDALATILIAFISVMLPFRLAFIDGWSSHWAVVDFCIDVFFLCDIVLNFASAYEDRRTGRVITDPRVIAINYVRGWLALDLIASFPLDWVVIGVSFSKPPNLEDGLFSQLPSMLRLFKLFKLLRLLRVARLLRLIRTFEARIVAAINHNSLRLLHLLFALVSFSRECAQSADIGIFREAHLPSRLLTLSFPCLLCLPSALVFRLEWMHPVSGRHL
jgi:hypothetical protein